MVGTGPEGGEGKGKGKGTVVSCDTPKEIIKNILS